MLLAFCVSLVAAVLSSVAQVNFLAAQSSSRQVSDPSPEGNLVFANGKYGIVQGKVPDVTLRRCAIISSMLVILALLQFVAAGICFIHLVTRVQVSIDENERGPNQFHLLLVSALHFLFVGFGTLIHRLMVVRWYKAFLCVVGSDFLQCILAVIPSLLCCAAGWIARSYAVIILSAISTLNAEALVVFGSPSSCHIIRILFPIVATAAMILLLHLLSSPDNDVIHAPALLTLMIVDACRGFSAYHYYSLLRQDQLSFSSPSSQPQANGINVHGGELNEKSKFKGFMHRYEPCKPKLSKIQDIPPNVIRTVSSPRAALAARVTDSETGHALPASIQMNQARNLALEKKVQVCVETVIESETNPNNGWPDFTPDQQRSFLKWHASRQNFQMQKLSQSMKYELDQMEKAQSSPAAVEAWDRAKRLEAEMDELEHCTPEHMKLSAWRFFNERSVEWQVDQPWR